MEFVLLPLAIVLLFYFILLKPQLASQKKHRDNIANLELGDEVLTTGGFFAIVLEIETQDQGPPVIMLEVAPGVELEGTPIAIAEVNPRGRPEDEDDVDDMDDVDDLDEQPHPEPLVSELPTATDEPSRRKAAE
jgi:preprotein translocase subunit YajC